MWTLQKVEIRAVSLAQEPDGAGIPFRLVQELIWAVRYGSVHSIGTKLLFYTGCRIAELDNMHKSKIYQNYIYWKCGKNQHGWRKEYLPPEFIVELECYWKNNRTPHDQVLGISSDTFTRYFRRDIRPNLSQEWQEHKVIINDGELEDVYKYVLKGLRKNFATLLFCYFWKKYDDAGVALEKVSKRMHHSSKHITANHYIETIEQIEADKYSHLMPFEILDKVVQTRIMDFTNSPSDSCMA